MDLKPDFLVTLNGAYIEDTKGTVIYQSPINEAIVSSFVDWAKESEIDYGLVASHQAALSNRTPLISDAIDIIYPNLPVDPDLHLKEPIFQMWTFDEQDSELELPPSLQENLRLVSWHPHSSDVVRFEASKASGVSHLVNHLGLKPENVLVFGDGLNDLELFDYAGISIAMGKSAPELQEKADYITKNLEEDGIFYALEELNMVEKELTLPQLELATVDGPVAVIKTNHGEMNIQLFPDQAPKTVANFVALAKSGYYDGVIFHRIIKDFMIQGEIQQAQVWVVNPSMGRASKTNFQKNCTIFAEPFQWQMLDQTQMAANSLLYKINISHIRKRNWSAVAGLKKLLKSIRQKGNSSPRSTPYRIWTIDG